MNMQSLEDLKRLNAGQDETPPEAEDDELSMEEEAAADTGLEAQPDGGDDLSPENGEGESEAGWSVMNRHHKAVTDRLQASRLPSM